MFRVLFFIGLALLLPGLAAMGVSLCGGPVEWFTDKGTFWGLPISLFVFWIGLAHAGTLISAIFLVLDIKMDRRTALLAEMSTLCSLAVAVCFPLVHLGVVENFYMVAPLMDARGNISNLRSPLVWDFCCIAAYGVLSLLFFVCHFVMEPVKEDSPTVAAARAWIKKVRRPMAWILFPLVLWVHTVVSLDFATTFVPQWQGAYFPLYFIAGAIYSGLALVSLLLMAENYRVRLIEKLTLVCSWFMILFWLWNFVLNGEFCVSAFVFAGLLPQLFFVEAVRESWWGHLFLCLSILAGMLLERIVMVSPSIPGFGWDWRWVRSLSDRPDAPMLEHVKVIAQRMAAAFEGTGNKFHKDFKGTISIIDLDKMAPVEQSLSNLSRATQSIFSSHEKAVAYERARKNTKSFGRKDDGSSFDLVDLYDYADKLSIPYVLFLGEDEIAQGIVTCKDMVTGEQTKLSQDETITLIRKGIDERNQGKVIVEK